ncbi:MAG: hypothetical protein J7521_10950 [Caulobacter sp.]|nr:hypothetical protein [Caulobacter sp.]
MSLSLRLKCLALAVGLAGLAGAGLLLACALRHRAEAPFLVILAVAWLGGCGLAKLVLDLTEAAPGPRSFRANRSENGNR